MVRKSNKRPNTRGMPGALSRQKRRVPAHAETKGAMSKTHKGEKDYTTKKSSKDFHRDHHDIVLSRRPFHRMVAEHLHGSFK